jgi:hypothetical protein
MPISVAVIATAGRIPTMMVRPPISVTMRAVSDTVRAKNESSVSTAEMSSMTALASWRSMPLKTRSCSADTVESSGSGGTVTMSVSRTLMTEIACSAILASLRRSRSSVRS